MIVIHTIAELREHLNAEASVVFVPTMGNLHEGHLDLVRVAHLHGHCVVVSIFVNPLQFGANEDLDKYPRTLQADCDKLRAAGVSIVFVPSVAEMYPQPQQIMVEPPVIAQALCGAFRPGHFRGVATVVLKLFNIVQPQVAIFGKKDYQQLHVIKELVAQLNLPLNIVGAETMRSKEGLALSSRNQYLMGEEQTESAFLHLTLSGIKQAIGNGVLEFDALEKKALQALLTRGWQVDYVSIRSQTTLLPPAQSERKLVILAAARLGKTRLIDNLEVCV